MVDCFNVLSVKELMYFRIVLQSCGSLTGIWGPNYLAEFFLSNLTINYFSGFRGLAQSMEQDEQQEIRRDLLGVHPAVGLSRLHLLLPDFPHLLQVGGLLRRPLHQGHQHEVVNLEVTGMEPFYLVL